MEITPEMIKAGVDVIPEYVPDEERETVVARIFTAMFDARMRSHLGPSVFITGLDVMPDGVRRYSADNPPPGPYYSKGDAPGSWNIGYGSGCYPVPLGWKRRSARWVSDGRLEPGLDYKVGTVFVSAGAAYPSSGGGGGQLPSVPPSVRDPSGRIIEWF